MHCTVQSSGVWPKLMWHNWLQLLLRRKHDTTTNHVHMPECFYCVIDSGTQIAMRQVTHKQSVAIHCILDCVTECRAGTACVQHAHQ